MRITRKNNQILGFIILYMTLTLFTPIVCWENEENNIFVLLFIVFNAVTLFNCIQMFFLNDSMLGTLYEVEINDERFMEYWKNKKFLYFLYNISSLGSTAWFIICVVQFFLNKPNDYFYHNLFYYYVVGIFTFTYFVVFVVIIYMAIKDIRKNNITHPITLPTQLAEVVLDGEECSICYDAHEHCIELQCRHKFHEICIETWRRISPTCPICRSSIYNYCMEYHS